MTNEEAAMELRYIKCFCYKESSFAEALDLAKKAIEKQIPKKPKTYIAFDGIERNGCPTCPRNEILYVGQNYCNVCGQRIDWEGESHDE